MGRGHAEQGQTVFFTDSQFMGFPAVRPSPIARSSSPSVQHLLPSNRSLIPPLDRIGSSNPMYHGKLHGCVEELEEKDHTAEVKTGKLVQEMNIRE